MNAASQSQPVTSSTRSVQAKTARPPGQQPLTGLIIRNDQALGPWPECHEPVGLLRAAAALDVDLAIARPEQLQWEVGGNGAQFRVGGEQRPLPDFVLARSGADTTPQELALLNHLQQHGVLCVNDPRAIELTSSKLLSATQLQGLLSLPRTRIVDGHTQPDDLVRELELPMILKMDRGTCGQSVALCETSGQVRDLIGLLMAADPNGTQTLLAQEFVSSSSGRDVRVLVVGGRAIAAMQRRSPDGDFKANVALGGLGECLDLTDELTVPAILATQRLGLDVAGVDLLFDEHGMVFCEANSAPGWQGLEACHPGLDVGMHLLQHVCSRLRVDHSLSPLAASLPAFDPGPQGASFGLTG